jgi:hypothetical protein
VKRRKEREEEPLERVVLWSEILPWMARAEEGVERDDDGIAHFVERFEVSVGCDELRWRTLVCCRSKRARNRENSNIDKVFVS